MSYQLIYGIDTEVIRVVDNASVPVSHPEYVRWLAEGNTPLPADEPTLEELLRRTEVVEAAPTARQYFRTRSAVVSFIRLTPAEQETAIASMNNAQLLNLVTHLTVAVSALIKERFLDQTLSSINT